MIYRKKTYKDVTDPRIWEIWEEVKDEARCLYPQYFEHCDPELYHDNSYSHLGYCSWSLANPSERNINNIRHSRCIITLSTNCGQDYDCIRKVLCHEIGHFVAPKEHHGYLWKVRADKIGKRWGYEASRLTDNETFNKAAKQIKIETDIRNPYKYRLYCPECGTEWKYKTHCNAIRRPEQYRCSKCKSNLKSEQII